ncbi:MAG TPA: MFS transporter [Gaiellales bacterium]|nr:MFS transporter [Gaiellales bacterium]
MSEAVRSIQVVLRNRELRRLQGAWTGSMIGACAYTVVLTVIAFRAGGATAVGVLTLIRMGASALASPPLSTLADRYPRRLVMAGSDLARAALCVLMAVLVEAGSPTLWIYVTAIIVSIVSPAFRPAQAALTPALAATPAELTASNAVAATIEGTAFFAGPGIGGILLGLSGVVAVFALCVAGFLWSAILILAIREPPRAADETASEPAQAGLAAGIRAIAGTPSLLAVTLTYGAQALVAGALGVFTAVLAIDVLGLGNAGVGYLDAAFGVGAIVGGVAAAGLAGTRRIAGAFAAGVLIWGVGVALLGATTSSVLALLLLGGVGAGNTVVDVAAVTLLQRSAPDVVLGRVFGAMESVLLAALGLGAVAAPLAIHAVGTRAALILTGLLLPVVVLLAARFMLPLDRVEPEILQRIALLRSHRVFAPLPDPVLEQLARRLEPVGVSAGAEVVRQGEPGDRVYLIASGALQVLVDGHPAPPLGAGDLFGEIALLRDVPRTATVTAAADCELLALGRDEFLAAVTGHPRSADEAEVVISTRLATLRPGVIPT